MDLPRQRHGLRLQLLPSPEAGPSSPPRRSAVEFLAKSPSLVSRAVANFAAGPKAVASPHLRRCLTEYDQYVGFLPSSVTEVFSPTCLYASDEGREIAGESLGLPWSSIGDSLHGGANLARGGSPLSSSVVRRGAENSASSSLFSTLFLNAPDQQLSVDGRLDTMPQKFCTSRSEELVKCEYGEEWPSLSSAIGDLPVVGGRFGGVSAERSSSPTNILRSVSVDCPVSVLGRRKRAEALLRSAVNQAAFQDVSAGCSEEIRTEDAGSALSSLPENRSACKREQSLSQLPESPMEDSLIERAFVSSSRKFPVGMQGTSGYQGSYPDQKRVKDNEEDSPSCVDPNKNCEADMKISSPGRFGKGRGSSFLLGDFHARLEATLHSRRRGGVASMRQLSQMHLQNQSVSASRNASPPRRREEEAGVVSRGGGRRRGRGRGGGVGRGNQTAAAGPANNGENLPPHGANSSTPVGDANIPESFPVFETAVRSAFDRQPTESCAGVSWTRGRRDVDSSVAKEVEGNTEHDCGGAGAKQATMIRLLSLSVDLGGEQESSTSGESTTSAGGGRKGQIGGDNQRSQPVDSDQQEGVGQACFSSRSAPGSDGVDNYGPQESPSDATTNVVDCSVASCSTVCTDVSQNDTCIRVKKGKDAERESVMRDGKEALVQEDSAQSLPLLNLEDLSLPLYPTTHATDCFPLTPTSSPLSSASRFARQVVFSASRSPRVGPSFRLQGRVPPLTGARCPGPLQLCDGEVSRVESDGAAENRGQPRCPGGAQEAESASFKADSGTGVTSATAATEMQTAADGSLRLPLDFEKNSFSSEDSVLLVRPLIPPSATALAPSSRGFSCSARLAAASAAPAVGTRCERGADSSSGGTGTPLLSVTETLVGSTASHGPCRCFVPEDSVNFFVEIRSTLLTLLEDLHEACCCCHHAASKEPSERRLPCCAYHFPGDFPSSSSGMPPDARCDCICGGRARVGETQNAPASFVEGSVLAASGNMGTHCSHIGLHALSSTSAPNLASWTSAASSGGRPRQLEPLSADALAAVDSPTASSVVMNAPHLLSDSVADAEGKDLLKHTNGLSSFGEISSGHKSYPEAGRTDSESSDFSGMECGKLEGDDREGGHKTLLRAQATSTISTTASLLTPACTPTAAAGCSWVGDVLGGLSTGAGGLCSAGTGSRLQTPSNAREFGEERIEIFTSEQQGEEMLVGSGSALKMGEGLGRQVALAGKRSFGTDCADGKGEASDKGLGKSLLESGEGGGGTEDELASSVSSGATRCPPREKHGTGEGSSVATPGASPLSSLSMPSTSGSYSLSLSTSRRHHNSESYERPSPTRAGERPVVTNMLAPPSSFASGSTVVLKCGRVHQSGPRHWSCSVCPFADCVPSSGPPGFLPRCGPELHRLFFEHADCIRSSRCFVEQLAYAHIFRICLEPVNGGRPSALSPTHQQFLIRELSLLRQEPSRLLARNAFLWTGQPGCQNIINQCAPFSPPSFAPPGTVSSSSRASYLLSHESALSRVTGGPSWRAGVGALCEGSSGGTSDNRLLGHTGNAECHWGSEPGATCVSGAGRVSSRGQAALAAALAAGDDSGGSSEGKAATVTEVPTADGAAVADNSRGPLPTAKALLDPSIFLCTADMELGAQKTALVTSLRVLRSLAPSWAAQTEGGFAYHLQQILDVRSLQSKTLQNYRVVLQELFSEPPRLWRHDRLVDVLHDLDCLYSVAKRKQDILQRAQEARQQSAAAPVDTRAPRSAGKNEGPWGTVTSSSHTGPVDASGSQLASAGMEGDDEVRRHAMGAGTHGGQRVFSEEQPWLQRGESFHPNDDEQSFRRGLSAGQKALEDEEAETGPPSVRTSLRKRQLQEAEQPDTRKLARSSSSDLSQSMFASAASLISHRSVAGGIRRQRQGTREEEGESATDDEGQTVQTELGSSTPLADEDLQALQQQLDLLERHGLKPSNVGAVLAGIFKTGGKEAALRALQRLLLPASQQALAALRDGGFTEQEQQFMLQQLLSDNGGLDDIKVVPEKEIRSLGRGPGSAGYSHGDSGRQSRKPAGPSTAAAFSSATCEDKALEYERFASTRGGAESMMKRHREDSMTFGDRQDMGQCEQVSNGFSAPPLLSSDPCQMDPATYDQRKTNVFQLPSLQNNVNVHSQGSSLGSSSRFKFRHSGGASPASTTDSGGTRSRGGPSGVRGRSGGIPSTSGAGKSGMRSEGRSGGAGSSGHGRGGSGRDAASAASHIEEQAERLEYARRATQLEKVKGVFIGKKNTCWVAQWTDSTGRSRQTCYNIKTLGFEVARQKAIEERYRQMEASAYANGGSHKHQLTNGTAGNNALKSSASSDLSKEQCAQSTPPPSSTLVPGRWPMHRSQEGGTADGAAGESGSACKSSSLPEVASIQAGGSGRGVTGPEVASESGSTRSASSSPLSNSALVAAVVEATASVLNSTARPSHRSSSLSSSVLAADLLAQFKNASIPGAPQMPSSLLRSLSGTGAGATSVPDNRPEPPPCGGVVSGVSSSSALQPTVTSIPLSDRDDKIFPAGSRPTYPCLLSSGAAGGTEMLDQAAFQGASAPPLCGGTLRNYEDADSTTHLDPRAANESRASQSAGAVLAALLENSAETEGTSGASAGAHSTNNGDPFVNGASTGTCSEPSMKSPSLAYLSAALAQAFPSLSGSSSGAAGSPGGPDRGAGSAASTASPAPSQLLQQLVQHVLQSPRMQRSPQESPKQVDDRRSGLTSSSPSPASASKSETDVEHLMKTLGRHGVTPELLEALQQLGGTSKDLMSGPDSVPSTCPPSSGVQAKNGKGKSSSTFLTSPHTPARRPGSPLSVHEEADAAPKSSVHSSSASPQIASSVGRDSSDAMDQLALLFGGAGYCQDGSCIDAYSVDFGAAGSIMSRKHRMAYTHKQGRRTYASQARDFPRVEGIKYNVKCACWEVTSRTGFKVFSTRRLGGLQEAYNLAVKWKQEVDGGLYRGSDDEMPHSLTPDQQRALILLSQGNSLSPDTGEDDDVEDEDEDNATEKHPGSQESDSSKGETNDVEGTDATTASALTMQQPGQAEWQKGAGLPSWSQLEAGILSALQASTGSQRAGAWAGEPFEAPPGKGDSVSSNGVSEADLLGSLLEQLAKSTGESRSGRQEGAETGLISDCGGGETVQMLTDSGGESRTGVQDGERSNDAKAYHIANSFLEKKRKNMDCDGTLVPIRRMGSQSGSVEGMAKKIKALP